MFEIQFSNRFEVLLESVVEQLGQAGGSVFEQPVVLVPSASMRRRITLALAEQHGICANLQFAYPAQWLWAQVARFDSSVQLSSPLDPGSLGWHALCAFNDATWFGQFPALDGYLKHADQLMRWQLASQVGAVLSSYVTYRSDWLEAWQRGEPAATGRPASEDERWQAALWRRISSRLGLGAQNPLLRFAEALEGGQRFSLPASVHVFCLPDIAPLHLRVLAALGEQAPIQLYSINPCAEYWFDVVDRKRLAYLKVQGKLDFHELGHRLLAGWGRQAQSHLSMLIDRLDTQVQQHGFIDPGQGSLLARLQQSILELQDLPAASITLDPSDRSIEFHECHSHSRELEVLHDRLLALFTADATLQPGDVLVVVPDLRTSAPLIDAVFASQPAERFIPYLITGLGRSTENPNARALLQLLQVVRSRWTVNEVVGLLELSPIGARFGFNADSLELVHRWLQQAAVRWGLNADHRASMELPARDAHSFSDGLDRLFLGYALPDQVSEPFGALLPAGAVQGAEALTLGAINSFIDQLAELRQLVSQPASVAAWAASLRAVLAQFCEATESPEDAQEVLAAITRFEQQAQTPMGSERVGADIVQAALTRLLDDPERGGVPSGAVTFAAISSLRNLPYRVVCMLGFDDGVFPAVNRPAEFDLISQFPKSGDRQRQLDERNLFLDQVLAAREVLHLSYVGRSIRDNAPFPPSVLVSELLEYLCGAIASDSQDEVALTRARQRLLVRQPLQPFSERSFSIAADPRVASHNQQFADALNTRKSQQVGTQLPALDGRALEEEEPETGLLLSPFFAAALSAPDHQWRDVSLQSLVWFFRNPCRYLLEKRLGLALPHPEQALQDDEPFTINWAERDALSLRLLAPLVEGAVSSAGTRLALAGTEVPAGQIGLIELQRTVSQLDRLASRARALLDHPLMPPFSGSIPLHLNGQAWQLHASFPDLRPGGLVRYQDRSAAGSDYLAAWLHQLVLAALLPPGCAPQVAWVLRETTIQFAEPADPLAHLTELLGLYENGLRFPSAFFPATAWAYARAGWNRQKAHAAWQPKERGARSEQQGAHVRLALRGLPDPLEHQFEQFDACARLVYEPLLAHLRETLA